jgi:hypothetical protein
MVMTFCRASVLCPLARERGKGYQGCRYKPHWTAFAVPIRYCEYWHRSVRDQRWSQIFQVTPHLDKYPNADLLWCQVRAMIRNSVVILTWSQEEPLNNGAWTYVGPRIYTAGRETQHHKGKYPHYAGRGPTSSVATGSKVTLLLIVVKPPSFSSMLD